MSRLEPPPLATWMLEHLTPADYDEALAGDLLEVFRSGRSNAWYWRQACAACAVAWYRSLRSRIPLVVFAVLWSMLAPAWVALTNGINQVASLAASLNRHWPLAAALWIALHAIFLWTGMLLYVAAHTNFRKSLRRRAIVRAFLLAPLIFLPAYAAVAILANLLWYPGLAGFRTVTPLAEIVDLQIWADALRVPYLIALLIALWRAVPQPSRDCGLQLAESAPLELRGPSGSLALTAKHDPIIATRFVTLTVTAGLVNAMIASFLLCRLPEVHAPDIASLAIRAALYVLTGVLGGVGGSWFYWGYFASPFKENPPLRFSLFCLVCASAWVWIPSMVLFHQQVSSASAFVAMAGAFVLASGLRSATRSVFAQDSHAPSLWEYNNIELFAESLYQPPLDLSGYGIAVSLCAAGWALTTRSNYTAGLLLGFSAFLFAWEWTVPRDDSGEGPIEYKRSAFRLAWVMMPAVLLTMWALIDGVALRNRAVAAQSLMPPASSNDAKPRKPANGGMRLSGYESIILWPVPEKKTILPPLPEDGLLAKGTRRPLIIHFNGVYWYFQPPENRPGPEAHQAQATPLDVDIHANNSIPLVMEAHQNLSSSVRVAQCREIDVTIVNRDHLPSAMLIALLLSNSAAPGKAALYLGQQPVMTSEPGQFPAGLNAAHETLRFFLPNSAQIQRFDEISVLFLPGLGILQAGPKMAIEDFLLVPR